MVKNFKDMYYRLDSIPACDKQTDRQTDRQTSCHGIVRAMHTRRAVKMLQHEVRRCGTAVIVRLSLGHFKEYCPELLTKYHSRSPAILSFVRSPALFVGDRKSRLHLFLS